MAKRKSPSVIAWLRQLFLGQEPKRPVQSVVVPVHAVYNAAKHPRKRHGRRHAKRRGPIHPKKRFIAHYHKNRKQVLGKEHSYPKSGSPTHEVEERPVESPATSKEETVPHGALTEMLLEEGWMQKAKAKDVEAKYPSSGSRRVTSIWRMTMDDLAHTYLPTLFGSRKPRGPSIGPAPAKTHGAGDPTASASGGLRGAGRRPSFVPSELRSGRQGTVEISTKESALDASDVAPVLQVSEEALSPGEKKKKSSPKSGSAGEMPTNLTVQSPASATDLPSIPKARASLKSGMGLASFFAAVKNFGLGRDRSLFVESMATMLDAGLPLLDTLKTLAAESHSRRMKKIISTIVSDIENGKPLWRAMEDQHLFAPHAMALVRIGEETGSLAKNMQYLAVQEDKDHQLRQKVKMAMFYPAIVCVLMFVIVMGLGIFILPQLVSVLYSLNVELPLVTRIVIGFAEIMSQYGMVILPGSFIGMFTLVIVMKFTPLRIVGQVLIFLLPGIGRLAREATIARFGVILGGLLRAGVPVVDALKSLVDVTSIVSYRRFYSKLLEHVSAGDSFATSFAAIRGSTRVLPSSVQQLVMSGEKSGALSGMMLKVADIYDRKASETAQKLPIVLEPMLLLIIGTLVGTIAFAIIVPIYGIVGNVGR